jgi:agmatine deiminase
MAIQMPPEWAAQDWLWIGFPHDESEWGGEFTRAQKQVRDFAETVAKSGQNVQLLVRNSANLAQIGSKIPQNVSIQTRNYGDIWLRDTGPLTVFDDGKRQAVRFAFNGWGGKFVMEGDESIGAELARDARLPLRFNTMVLEGGAIDTDGTGLCVTTEQCLLNPNRNPEMSREDVEAVLGRELGLSRVLWLGEGLKGDHTDGHVDNLARFVGANHLVIPMAETPADPNAEIFEDAARRASDFGCKMSRIPSVGAFEQNGAIAPASYANFVITNALVIVPQFGVPQDQAALEALAALFPDRQAIGLASDAILSGGGSFHCASMQMPAKQG